MRFTRPFAFLFFVVVMLCFSTAQSQTINITEIANNLNRPVALANAGDGSGRLFIVEQDGFVKIYDGTQVLPDLFLDISTKVACCGERGLLGLAFHPNFENNGFFYVFYTAENPLGDLTIARYHVPPATPNVADPNSELILKTVPHGSAGNHNGGQLQFGPDGMLYASTGDGGGAGDPEGDAQNINNLLGKILRLNVNAAAPYIPNDNPFVGTAGADEIWAYGLRNPWRFSFDRLTGDLFVGDVGQGCYEEVSFQPANSNGGENYGWREMEGLKCYAGGNCNAPPTCNTSNKVAPIIVYAHADNPAYQAVTGGYVYRGSQSPALAGKYIFADYGSGHIWAATQSGGSWAVQTLSDTDFLISSFGEDEAGEIYFTHNNSLTGAVYHISAAPDLPYNDDFEDNDISNWNVLKGNWTAVNGNLQGTSNRKATITSSFGGCAACSILTDVQINTPGARASVLGWYQSKHQLVELILFDDSNKMVLKQRSGGRIVAKRKLQMDVQSGVNYQIQIDYDGTQFRVFLNGDTTPAITLDSQAPSIGTVGYRVKATSGANATISVQGIQVN